MEKQNDFENNMKNLVQLMTEKGADLDKLHVKEFKPGHRGLVAIKQVKNGERLLMVPESLIISE